MKNHVSTEDWLSLFRSPHWPLSPPQKVGLLLFPSSCFNYDELVLVQVNSVHWSMHAAFAPRPAVSFSPKSFPYMSSYILCNPSLIFSNLAKGRSCYKCLAKATHSQLLILRTSPVMNLSITHYSLQRRLSSFLRQMA